MIYVHSHEIFYWTCKNTHLIMCIITLRETFSAIKSSHKKFIKIWKLISKINFWTKKQIWVTSITNMNKYSVIICVKYLFVLLLMWNLKYLKPLNSPFYNNFEKWSRLTDTENTLVVSSREKKGEGQNRGGAKKVLWDYMKAHMQNF